jgi:hypothetical protein
MKQLLALAVLALATPVQAQDGIISSFKWFQIDAYCVFQREGQVLVYDRPETWDFVFFSQFGPTGKAEDGAGFMSIGHRLMQFELRSTDPQEKGEVRHYRSYGRDPYTVTITLFETIESYEAQDYAGSIVADGPLGHDEVDIEGTCGV